MQSFWSEIGTFPYFSQGIWGPGFPEFCPESWGVDKNMGNTSSELTPFELFLKYHQNFYVSYDGIHYQSVGLVKYDLPMAFLSLFIVLIHWPL